MEKETANITMFTTLLHRHAQAVEARLDAALSPSIAGTQNFVPPRLLAAMRHGVFNGGKRLRPFLLLETAALFAGEEPESRQNYQRAALECAAALEAAHCYSLIHDDLPAMDNDDWRRGKPTVHKAYDDATAILAGNALFTLAFQLLTAPDNGLKPPIQAELSYQLALAAGAGGMIGGQMLDILAENQQKTAEEIITLEMMKTGALLRFACLAGAILGQTTAENRLLMAKFGTAIGFAFQLADDILDISGSQAALGKTPGKDVASGKATLIALYGEAKARALLAEKLAEAQNMLAPFGARADILRQAAHFIACRCS